MSRDYITNRERNPAGSEPGTGYGDIQQMENVDYIFGDNEKMIFGDGEDASICWNGTDLALAVGPGSLVITGTHGAVSGEEHTVDIVSTGLLGSGEALVGLNILVTPTTGGAGQWASGLFAKVTLVGTALPGTGYCSGAELEVQVNAGATPSDVWILNMNSSNNQSMSPGSAYICMHEYGSSAMKNFLWFYETTRASASDTVIVSQVGAVSGRSPYDTAIRCRVGTGGTQFWLMGSTVGPATIADFKVPGSVAANYVEYDASADRLNVVVTTRTITGEEHAVDVSHAGELSSGESIVGVNVAVAPTGTAGLWASAFFGKVTVVGNALPGTGYCSGAEFEVNYSSGITPSDMWVLSLNAGNNSSMSPNSAFIALHQYGSALMLNLFCAPQDSVGTYGEAKMVCACNASTTPDKTVRIRVGSTTLYLLATDSPDSV